VNPGEEQHTIPPPLSEQSRVWHSQHTEKWDDMSLSDIELWRVACVLPRDICCGPAVTPPLRRDVVVQP
jgi:hypothetical protein